MYKCKHCGKKCKTPQQLGGHVVTCLKNPNLRVLDFARTHTRKKKQKVNCSYCNKEYIVLVTERGYNKGMYKKYCSRSCAMKQVDKMLGEFLECPWCYKVFIWSGLRSHIWHKHTKEGRKFYPRLKRTGSIPWNKGLTKETDKTVKMIGEKVSKTTKGRPGVKLSNQTKKKISEYMLEKYKNGYSYTGCFVKKYDYESPIAGRVSLDGTWELRVAIFFDGSELNWRRNTNRFKYINPKTNNESTYIPDFYVHDWETYIEVKGYISEVDKAKWEQFPEKLEIWDESKLKEYGILPQ